MTSRKPPSQRSSEYTLRRINRAMTSMVPGTMGGRVANASPLGFSSTDSGPDNGGVAEIVFSFYGLLHNAVSPPYRVSNSSLGSFASVTATLGSAGLSATTVDVLNGGISVATVVIAAGATTNTVDINVSLAQGDVLNGRVTTPGDGATDVTIQLET